MYLMLDIETLSLRHDAAVVAIGCALFDLDGTLYSQGWRIAPADWHGHIDPRTVDWWLQQSPEAQRATFGGNTPAARAAMQLAELVFDRHKPLQVWANDPSFDITILKHWWSRVSVARSFPISYKAERSYRTITALAKRYGIDYAASTTRQRTKVP